MNKYHHTISFGNGYSASITSTEFSYGGNEGLFEIAVLRGGIIVYNTPVTNDVLGYLSFSEVAKALEEIENLPPVE